jgi:hypothetical protein
VENNHGLPLHRWQVVAIADFLESLAALFEGAPRMAMIVSVEQAAVAGDRVALDPPIMKEPPVVPELFPASGFVHDVQ